MDHLSKTNLGRVKYVELRIPTTSELNAHIDEIFVDSTTGVHYMCLDDTENAQVWRGTDGALIEPIIVDPILLPSHPDLVAMYTMDTISGTTLVDESLNGNNGTIGTGITSQLGRIGDSLQGNGSAIVTLPNLGISGNSPRAFSFFIKMGASVTAKGIIGYGSTTINPKRAKWNIAISIDSTGDIYVESQDANVYTAGAVIDNSAFYHVVVQYDGTVLNGTAMQVYVDGNLVGVTPVGSALGLPAVTTEENYKLFALSSGGLPFDGSLDQIRIFNRVLTQQEITALYNEGAP